MAILIACLSSGRGTWGHVARLMREYEWDKVYLLTNDFGKENFKVDKEMDMEFLMIDARKSILDIVTDVKNALEPKIKDTEVAVNLVSGSGREHMAILSALLKLGLGIRLMALTKEGIKEI